MSEHMSLEEIYRHSVTFPGPHMPLFGLRTALKAVEEELAHASDQATVRLQVRHNQRANCIHPDDRDLDLHELEVTVRHTLPRVFRGGFVLTLWSVFEVVAKRMAEYVCRERRLPTVQSKFRHNFLVSLDKVYADLTIVAFPDPAIREQLDQLRHIRNALIHRNGSVAALPESMRVRAPDSYATLGLQTYEDLHDEFFVPTADFLTRNFSLVEMYLTTLSERVYAAVHPMPIEETRS